MRAKEAFFSTIVLAPPDNCGGPDVGSPDVGLDTLLDVQAFRLVL